MRIEEQPTHLPGHTPPAIIARAHHTISRRDISDYALKVLYRLHEAGYQAYLVGGGVRDLLLGREPKDFDVATNARPDEIKRVFRNCRLIGRRFRLAHVHFGLHIIEVATFRAAAHEGDEDADAEEHDSQEGRILRDNVYGTLEEDAWRRDFTVNALYYNIDGYSVVDYVGGMEDLRNGLLRPIGDPAQRYREDPVRMLRAARFAAKLGFRLHPDAEQPLFALGRLLSDVPSARLWEEILKLMLAGYGLQSFEILRHYRLFEYLFPQTEACLALEEHAFPLLLVARALGNSDARVAAGKPVTPAFLFAALLWEPVRIKALHYQEEGTSEFQSWAKAADEVIHNQTRIVAIPKRFSLPMREIWLLQMRFNNRLGKRPLRLFAHPRFRAAYDFLLLRAETGEAEPELAQWWTEFQAQDETQRQPVQRPDTPPTKRRRRRGRRSATKPAATEV